MEFNKVLKHKLAAIVNNNRKAAHDVGKLLNQKKMQKDLGVGYGQHRTIDLLGGQHSINNDKENQKLSDQDTMSRSHYNHKG